MSDDDLFRPEDELTAEQDAWVSRLLAEAGAPAEMPAEMPAEFTTRLDATLAALVSERSGGATPTAATSTAATSTAATPAPEPVPAGARVVPLRRRVSQGLLVAAAVTLGGFALPHVVQQSGGDADSGSADSAGIGAESAPDVDRLDGGLGADAEKGGATAPGELRLLDASAASRTRVARPVDRLSSARFDDQVERLATVVTDARPRYAAGSGPSCALPPVVEGGRWWVVRLDGTLAALVLEPLGSGGQVARAYSCDDGGVLATTTLP